MVGGNVLNEKQSEHMGGLGVSGSAYGSYHYIEKAVFESPPKVVQKAAATTNTTPPVPTPPGELSTPSPRPRQQDAREQHLELRNTRNNNDNNDQLTGETIYNTQASGVIRGTSQETKRKITHPRVSIKASEPKKEPGLGEVHKLLQHNSIVRNQHIMDFIVKHKKKEKNGHPKEEKVKDNVLI